MYFEFKSSQSLKDAGDLCSEEKENKVFTY
jgi:hypothetical protein